MKRFLPALCLLSILAFTACSQSAGGHSPTVALREPLLAYKGMTCGTFQEQAEEEPQMLHADRFSAPLEEGVEIVFLASGFDQETASPVLLPSDPCLRLSGELSALFTGIDQETQDLGQLAQGLSRDRSSPLEYQLLEGAGTAYYVGNQYAQFPLDADGDGIQDAFLEISLDDGLTPHACTWVVWGTVEG